MKEQSYIYFLTNRHNNVLYIGVTVELIDAVKWRYREIAEQVRNDVNRDGNDVKQVRNDVNRARNDVNQVE